MLKKWEKIIKKQVKEILGANYQIADHIRQHFENLLKSVVGAKEAAEDYQWYSHIIRIHNAIVDDLRFKCVEFHFDVYDI